MPHMHANTSSSSGGFWGRAVYFPEKFLKSCIVGVFLIDELCIVYFMWGRPPWDLMAINTEYDRRDSFLKYTRYA